MPWKDPVSGLVSADKSVFTTGAGVACGALSPADTSEISSYSVQTCLGKRPASIRYESQSDSEPDSKKAKEAVADTLRGLHASGIKMKGYDEQTNTILDEKDTDITTALSWAEIKTLHDAHISLQTPVYALLSPDEDDLLSLTGKKYHELSVAGDKDWKNIAYKKNQDGTLVFEGEKLKGLKDLHKKAQNQANYKKSKCRKVVNTIISDAIGRNLPETETSTTSDALLPADTEKASSDGLLTLLHKTGIKIDGYDEKTHAICDTEGATVKLSPIEMGDLQQAYASYQKPILAERTTEKLATLRTTGATFEKVAYMTRNEWEEAQKKIAPKNGRVLSDMEKKELSCLRRKARNMNYSRKLRLEKKVHEILSGTARTPITEKRPETPPPEMPSEQP